MTCDLSQSPPRVKSLVYFCDAWQFPHIPPPARTPPAVCSLFLTLTRMTHCRRVASQSILSRRNQRVLLCRSASYTLGEKRCERRPVCDFSRWSSSGFLKGRWHRAAATSLTSVSLDILFFCWMIGCFFDTKGFQTNLNSSKKNTLPSEHKTLIFRFHWWFKSGFPPH